MSAKRRAASRPKGRQKVEWIGAPLQPPFYVTEGKPYRPDAMLWMELHKLWWSAVS